MSRKTPDKEVEFWFARDLMEPLGYVRWENFKTVIKRAIESCETTGDEADNHFRGVTKMIEIVSHNKDRLVPYFPRSLKFQIALRGKIEGS